MSAQEIKVPDIGDFSDVPVIEIHVAAGDQVNAEDPLVTLESDKATLDVPAPVAGTVSELRIAVGDAVSEGTVIMVIDAGAAPGPPRKEQVTQPAAATGQAVATRSAAGPAGYGTLRGATDAAPRRQHARRRRRRCRRVSAVTSTPRCWCWVPGLAATPPRSGPPTSASRL